jgi:hypothetical protein
MQSTPSSPLRDGVRHPHEEGVARRDSAQECLVQAAVHSDDLSGGFAEALADE